MTLPPFLRDRRLFTMAAFGYFAGLPLPLSGFTLTQWLAEGGISLAAIGLTANIGLAYTLKFLWSPLLDQRAPLAFLGRRRGWLAAIQPALALAIAALAFSSPHIHPLPTFLIAAGIAFLSASQDIVIDAWRIETFPPDSQGPALGAYVLGYRAAMLTSGAGVIASVGWLGWHGALLGVAGLFVIGLGVTLLAGEPEPPETPPAPSRLGARVAAAIVEPLRDFLARPGAWLVLAYVALFYLDEALAGKMLAPLYRALGFDRATVALATGPISLTCTLLGYAMGGTLVAWLGMGRALIATGFTQMGFMSLYVVLTLHPGNTALLYTTVALEAFVQAMAMAAFIAYLSSLCTLRFTATQYALLSSIAAMASHTLGGLSGFGAQALGWTAFYSVAMFSALPSMVLMLVILRHFPPMPQGLSGRVKSR
ncbi:MAG: MFS transporter [Acetobacteraceae bacterium]|nr:MFS transporter [Acetobacteraceae bacterium]